MITASKGDVEGVENALAQRIFDDPDPGLQLRRIVEFALKMVPFYRNHWERLSNFFSLGDLPFVERFHVSAQLVDLCSDDLAARRVFRHRTSGTSGNAIIAIVDIHDWFSGLISIASQLEMLGFPVLGTPNLEWRYCQITSYPFNANAEFVTPLPGKPVWCRVNFPCIPALEPKLDAAKRIMELTNRMPVVLNGLPNVLLAVARLFSANRLPMPRPPIIITSGAHLSQAERIELEEYYNTKVYSFYSTGEAGVIGFECKLREGYHLETTRLLTELVTSKTEGKEIVTTTLQNFAMPLVRYKVGDFALDLPEECSCGDKRPRIGSIVGRILKAYDSEVARAFQTSPPQ